MKKILVPTDFSSTSSHAFRFACDIASRTKAEIYLLNVIEFPRLNGSLPVPVQAYEQAYIKSLRAKASKSFDEFKSKWGKKLKIHFSIEHGSISNIAQKFATKKKIDLIVMGTHGASGVAEYFIGSNAEKLVQTSKVPVISIKSYSPVSSIKHLIFPTNLRSGQNKLLARVKSLQDFFKARLELLFVNTPGDFRRDVFVEKRLKEFAKENKLRNFTLNIFNDIDEEEGIINFASKFKNYIIAMSTHGRKGINHLFSGSIAEDVVNHIRGPVWTLTFAG